MFIVSIKAQTLKLILSLAVSVFVILAVVFLTPENAAEQAIEVSKREEFNYENIVTNEDRINFLLQFGWKVEPEAHGVKEVVIPMEFNKTYQEYNDLQLEEGLDLERYKGKSVKIYTYLVSNYDYNGSVFASIIIYKDKVIGGDISSAKQDGFMHGFIKENT